MPLRKAVFISHSGTRREVDVADGTSLMKAAVSNSIYDIVGDCGGSASCATCHVYVDKVYLASFRLLRRRRRKCWGVCQQRKRTTAG
jgi:hypothetical protein